MSEESTVGYLIVRANTAGGAIPIENATVIIQGLEAENENIFYSLLTNRDGATQRVALPTKSKALSESPRQDSKPYLSYNINVYAVGYYPQRYTDVPIFEGVIAVQNARLIPSAELGANDPYYSISQTFDESTEKYL